MPTLEETLKRLAVTFTVKDIMISQAALVTAVGESEAAEISRQHPDFTVIPIRTNGKLNGYFERDSGVTRAIRLDDLISDGTSLLDIVEIFETRQFSFVLSHQQIAGYIHFSDLNHHLVKLTFYVILQALERRALSLIQVEETDAKEYLRASLDRRRFDSICGQYERDGDSARCFFNYLNISDVLKLAVSAGKIQMATEVINASKEIRNGAAHPSENIVANYESVKKLGIVGRACLRILANI